MIYSLTEASKLVGYTKRSEFIENFEIVMNFFDRFPDYGPNRNKIKLSDEFKREFPDRWQKWFCEKYVNKNGNDRYQLMVTEEGINFLRYWDIMPEEVYEDYEPNK